VKEPTDASIEHARLAGIDLKLIEINLSLAPGERWRKHDMTLTVIQEFEQAQLTCDGQGSDGRRCKGLRAITTKRKYRDD